MLVDIDKLLYYVSMQCDCVCRHCGPPCVIARELSENVIKIYNRRHSASTEISRPLGISSSYRDIVVSIREILVFNSSLLNAEFCEEKERISKRNKIYVSSQ